MSEQECKKRGLFFARILSSIFLVSLCLSVSISASATLAEDKEHSGAVANLRKGKDLLEKQKYNEALENLKLAYDELPVVRDYILFFMARAYKELDKPEDSAKCVRKLLKTYPDSLLRKRVRAFEINKLALDSESYFTRLESYVADYPEDAEMTFILAGLLKDKGLADRSQKMLMRLYTGNTSYSEKAYQELGSSAVTTEDMLAKVTNLVKVFEYRKAETILRKMLPSAAGEAKDELLKKLGVALFGQKKYKDAAYAFMRAGDPYNGARSFLRAGDLDAFKEAMSKLASMEDTRAGSLLITYAARKRREGAVEDALKIYQDVKEKYPSHAEDALWGIAWTYFRARDNEAALSALTELDTKYSSPRYRYWKQRCSGVDMSGTRTRKNGFYKDIYSLLSELKDSGSLSGRLAKQATWTPGDNRFSSTNVSLPSDVRLAMERFDILVGLEMKDDAVSELLRAANRASHPEVFLYVCRKLQEAGAYNKSLSLMLRSPGAGPTEQNDLRFNSLLYPFAFWPAVSETSRRYALDPLLLLSVMREESRFDPSARSFAGALGLMQIMPETAHALDKKLGMNISDGVSIYNVRKNIALGAYHLNSLLKEFGSLPVALAAYNAGRDKVKEWLKAGNYDSYDEFIEDIPFDETRNYVKKVLLTYSAYLNLGGMR